MRSLDGPQSGSVAGAGTPKRSRSREKSSACYDSNMSTVTLKELQRDPDALLDRVEAGEHLVVVRGGRPVAELRPFLTAKSDPRPFGLCAGAFTVPDDFDAPLPEEILRGFEGQ
jgi:antitoxin (DNA-binding transcriptional repressor) of toxin-antitoxin stability system